MTPSDSAAPAALLSVEGALGELVLNRPDKLNAMDDAMVALLLSLLDDAEAAGARALLVRGEGRAFCAGRDLSAANPLDEDGERILADIFNPLMRRVAEFPAPTFAAVHGACLGTGLGLAMACDVVYAADDARIGSPFARIGAVLDSGSHAAFAQRIGAHRALELVYTGVMLDGTQAAEWGLVNRSMGRAELLRRTRAVARQVAAGPTAAFLESKRLVRAIVDGGLSYLDVLAAEAAAQGRASRTRDYREGILAFQEKRVVEFEGR